MTSRERLYRLIDDLSDDRAAEALALLESQLAGEREPGPLPEFFGMLHSGKGDLAARSASLSRFQPSSPGQRKACDSNPLNLLIASMIAETGEPGEQAESWARDALAKARKALRAGATSRPREHGTTHRQL